MIDSHCHLNFKSLSNDLPNIIKRCADNGITHLLTINTKPEDFENHLNLIDDYKNIYISYGIHPEEVNNKSNLFLSEIEKIIKNPKLIALGEKDVKALKGWRYDIFGSFALKLMEGKFSLKIKNGSVIID